MKKNPCHTKLCAFRYLISRLQSLKRILKSNSWKITSFFENYVPSEGAVSQNVLYQYTINSSPLLIAEGRFLVLAIILSNYQ